VLTKQPWLFSACANRLDTKRLACQHRQSERATQDLSATLAGGAVKFNHGCQFFLVEDLFDVILWYNSLDHEEVMHTTNLRKVGGSIMLAVPPALLDLLHLEVGAKVGLAVDNGRLVVEPTPRPKYKLSELIEGLQESDVAIDRTFMDVKPRGREEI
jgi:antitoxin ChpS